MGRFDYWGYYPPTAPRPKPVAGKRNKKFGLTWWGRRWVDIVEARGDENRMSRGRAYARAEHVYNIRFDKGKITAKVKGNSGTYKVTAAMKQFSEKDWTRMAARLQQSDALGPLLNNELPEHIDRILGVQLIDPKLRSTCSCPDWGDPCKHVAALYYVLADEIDKAPMVLFALRGVQKSRMQEAFFVAGAEAAPGGVAAGPAGDAASSPAAAGGRAQRQVRSPGRADAGQRSGAVLAPSALPPPVRRSSGARKRSAATRVKAGARRCRKRATTRR